MLVSPVPIRPRISPKQIVVGNEALHHVEHGFVQRDVDHLSLASARITVMQRHERADHAVQRRERVADADVHAHRRPIRKSGDVAHAAHRFADGAETRRSRYGPVWPKPDSRTMISPGLSAASTS